MSPPTFTSTAHGTYGTHKGFRLCCAANHPEGVIRDIPAVGEKNGAGGGRWCVNYTYNTTTGLGLQP